MTDPTPNNLPVPKPLSPAAQAVLDAAFPAYDDENLYVATGEQHAGMIAAAALCALADQVVPDETGHTLPIYMWFRFDERKKIRNAILAIVTELKNQP
jgi:glycine/D-amino acid oxidase-like deaminating enzyme